MVSINNFISDSEEEVALVKAMCAEMGVKAVPTQAWAMGGDGAMTLAQAVVEEVESGKNDFKPYTTTTLV